MAWVKIKRNSNYSINEHGEVRNNKTGHIKSAFKNKRNNYWTVDLYRNNKSDKVPIHRLLAEVFLPNLENKPTVDHIDGNRENNSLNNLRWATYSEQNSRFETVGVRSERLIVTKFEEFRKKRGGGHIKWGEAIEIMYFDSITQCAEYFDCTISNISLRLESGRIGRRGKTRGYLIEYAQGSRVTHS
ncbi:MAG: HNH endonuclease [Aerococcus sanguinicola]